MNLANLWDQSTDLNFQNICPVKWILCHQICSTVPCNLFVVTIICYHIPLKTPLHFQHYFVNFLCYKSYRTLYSTPNFTQQKHHYKPCYISASRSTFASNHTILSYHLATMCRIFCLQNILPGFYSLPSTYQHNLLAICTQLHILGLSNECCYAVNQSLFIVIVILIAPEACLFDCFFFITGILILYLVQVWLTQLLSCLTEPTKISV